MNVFTRRSMLTMTLLAIIYKTPAAAQGVITKDGKSFEIISNGQLGDTNEVRIASRAQVAGGQLHQTEWWISKEIIERQPRWDGLSTEPPFTVQKACALALPDIKKRFPSVLDWVVETVFIRNLLDVTKRDGNRESHPNIWAYEITFMPADKDTRDKFEDDVDIGSLTQVVLFDGTLVTPKIKK